MRLPGTAGSAETFQLRSDDRAGQAFAGIAAEGSHRDKPEHLARYVLRPPAANGRLAMSRRGPARCTPTTPSAGCPTSHQAVYTPCPPIRFAALLAERQGAVESGMRVACQVTACHWPPRFRNIALLRYRVTLPSAARPTRRNVRAAASR